MQVQCGGLPRGVALSLPAGLCYGKESRGTLGGKLRLEPQDGKVPDFLLGLRQNHRGDNLRTGMINVPTCRSHKVGVGEMPEGQW